MAATVWLMLSFSSCTVCGFDSYTVLFYCPRRKFSAIKMTVLHRIYLNMVTARLLTDCSYTLRNILTNTRENITRTREKLMAG